MSKLEGKVDRRLGGEGGKLRALDCVIRRILDGYELEVDRRHTEILVFECGLDANSLSLTTLARKVGGKAVQGEAGLLAREERRVFVLVRPGRASWRPTAQILRMRSRNFVAACQRRPKGTLSFEPSMALLAGLPAFCDALLLAGCSRTYCCVL